MDLISKLDLIGDLGKVTRYSQSHLVKPESVLEHTGFVVLLAMLITEEINSARGVKVAEKEREPTFIHLATVLARAAVHDLDEVITGDLPRPTKYNNEVLRDEIVKVEKKNMKRIAEEQGMPMMFYLWRDAKDKSEEGCIIRLCDFIAVLYKIRQELLTYGNSDILNHVTHMKEGISNQLQIAISIGFNDIIPFIKEAASLVIFLENKRVQKSLDDTTNLH